jgi:hypothetical protein
VTVAHDGVGAEQQRARGGVVVERGRERRRPRHQVEHVGTAGRVDRERRVLRARAHGPLQRERGASARGVERRGGGEVEGHGIGSRLGHDRRQARREVVEQHVVGDGPERAVDAHLRAVEAVRVVVPLPRGPTLRAGVAARQRVVGVAPHADDAVALGRDDEAAHGRADATERTVRHGIHG